MGIGVLDTIDVLEGAGKIKVMGGNGTSVVVGVIEGVVLGVSVNEAVFVEVGVEDSLT